MAKLKQIAVRTLRVLPFTRKYIYGIRLALKYTRGCGYRKCIMIHSRKQNPAEIFDFVAKFRAWDAITPIVVVPTSFNIVTEEEFKVRGVNIVIYANQLTRAGFPAMQNAAKLILENHRAKECDDICMSINDIITLIPEED